MRYGVVVSLVIAAGMLLTGCETPYGRPNRTATGALIGAGFGAAGGALVASRRHQGSGALIGGAIGALYGGMIGQSMDIQAEQRERLEAQAPRTWERIQQAQPLVLADIKALAQAGVSDDVIISQINSTRTVYHLSTADIIDLKNSGVSEVVIDYMINTPRTAAASEADMVEDDTAVVYSPPPMPVAPPPTYVETIVVAPAPGFIWIDSAWGWGGGSWVWASGYWAHPPHQHATWVHGRWAPYHGRSRWVHPHWR